MHSQQLQWNWNVVGVAFFTIWLDAQSRPLSVSDFAKTNRFTATLTGVFNTCFVVNVNNMGVKSNIVITVAVSSFVFYLYTLYESYTKKKEASKKFNMVLCLYFTFVLLILKYSVLSPYFKGSDRHR